MKKIHRNVLLMSLLTVLLCVANSCSQTGKQELANKREEWKSKQIGDYRYNLRWLSQGRKEIAGKIANFEVREGKNVLLDCPECETRTPEFLRQLDTIDKIFDFMEKTISTNPYNFEIKYDENFSVPIRFYVEEKGPNTSDDEWRFEISDFQPIK